MRPIESRLEEVSLVRETHLGNRRRTSTRKNEMRRGSTEGTAA